MCQCSLFHPHTYTHNQVEREGSPPHRWRGHKSTRVFIIGRPPFIALTIHPHNETIHPHNETIHSHNETIHSHNDTIHSRNETIQHTNQSIQSRNETIRHPNRSHNGTRQEALKGNAPPPSHTQANNEREGCTEGTLVTRHPTSGQA